MRVMPYHQTCIYRGNIYDGVFRIIVNDCRKLLIPVINEVFAEDYTGDEEDYDSSV